MVAVNNRLKKSSIYDRLYFDKMKIVLLFIIGNRLKIE